MIFLLCALFWFCLAVAIYQGYTSIAMFVCIAIGLWFTVQLAQAIARAVNSERDDLH